MDYVKRPFWCVNMGFLKDGRYMHFLIEAINSKDINRVKEVIARIKSNDVGYVHLLNSPNEGGHLPLHLTCLINDTQILRELINAKVTLDAADKSGEVALHKAVSFGNLNAVNILLDAGAKIDICNNDGQNAAHLAAMFNRADILKTLIMRGINYCQKDRKETTPLQEAILLESNDAVNILLRAGAALFTDLKDKKYILSDKIGRKDVVFIGATFGGKAISSDDSEFIESILSCNALMIKIQDGSIGEEQLKFIKFALLKVDKSKQADKSYQKLNSLLNNANGSNQLSGNPGCVLM